MFASLQHRRKFDEATSATDDVTPVYLLEEIWQSVHGSGPEVSHAYVEAAHKRLSHKSPVVKQKTLRVIKYVCSKGSSDFKRAIAKHATAIRDLTHFKGEPDPFKGDAPNQKVRESAKEALDAVFSATDTSYSAAASSNSGLQGRIQGFGSAVGESGPHSGASVSSGPSSSSYNPATSGSSRYQGFGNPRFENRPSGSASSSARDTAAGWVSSGISQVKDLVGSKRPGILRDEEKTGYSSDEGGMGSTYRVPGPPPTPTFSTTASPAAAAPAADGSEEERLVENICSRGGLRAQPDREALRLFVESLTNLSGSKVAHQLQHKIERGGWQEMLRALCALEAVVQQGVSASCGECAIHFQSDPSCIQAACKSPQVSVRQRAMKVMQLVAGDAAAVTSVPSAPAATANGHQQPVADLLGPDTDAQSPSAAAAAAAAAPDLLGDLLDPLPASGGAAASAAAAPGGMGGLFNGLDMGAGPAATPSAGGSHVQQQQSSRGTQQQPEGDLFGGLTTGPAAAAAPPAGSSSQPSPTAAADMFGGLSLAGAEPAAAPMMDDFFAISSPSANGGAPSQGLGLPQSSSFAPQQPDPLAGLSMGMSQGPSRSAAPGMNFGKPGLGMMGNQGIPTQNGGPSPYAAGPGGPRGVMPPSHSGLGMSHGMQPSQLGGMQGLYGTMGMPGQQQPQPQQQPQYQPQMQPGQAPNLVYMPGMQAAMYGGPIPGGLPPAQFAYIQRMMGGNFPGQPQQQPPTASFGYGQYPPQRAGSNSSGAIPADAFGQPAAAGRTVSDLMGREIITKKDTFDFVGDHLDTLKITK
ncbi:hypothetical protein WJX84_009352 [Apatococcus fuscideae]|uniref:VHS domain-containing protein n=1 Tax=Apatococcus fuscideae TaxID=2026836 RepID=A0AAW1TDU4_9CHLO